MQPQLGLLKSTMLQLDPAFSEKAYGCGSFSEFVEKLKRADFVNVTGTGGRHIIERKGTSAPEMSAPKPEEAHSALARYAGNSPHRDGRGRTAGHPVRLGEGRKPGLRPAASSDSRSSPNS